MHKLILTSVAALSSFGLATAALAEGPYVSIMGGAAILQDVENTDDVNAVITSEFDMGFAIVGAGGYGWASGLRVEGEIGYRTNDADQLELTSGFAPLNGQKAPADGDMTALSFMANVAYDFQATPKLKPYVMAGAGFANVSADITAALTGIKLVDDDDTVFAWQIGGGLTYEITPKVGIFLDYRYFATADPSFETDPAFTGTPEPFDSEYGSHNVSAGVRVSF